MLFSDLKGRKLVSTTTADTVGKVDEFLLDPAVRSVVALRFKKTPQGSVVAWSDLTAVGEDAVTLTEADLIVDLDSDAAAAYAGKDHAVLKKRVLTRGGEELGHVTDIDFDPSSGALVALVLKGGATVAGEKLVGVGSYAVVVDGA